MSAQGSELVSYGRGHHVIKRHLPLGEVAHGPHVPDRNPVRFPLRDRRGGYVEVRSESRAAALLGIQPCVQVHAANFSLP